MPRDGSAVGSGQDRIGGLLRRGADRLAAAGVAAAGRDAGWLLAALLGTSRGRLELDAAAPVDATVRRRFEDWVDRRSRREPLQHILGSQPFRTVEIAVDRCVLIPRPETERVVDLCLALHRGGPVLDIGTGSGAIAIAIAVERPGTMVVATDISRAALVMARANATRAGAGVSFVCGDLLLPVEPLLGRCDLLVCNPPYVASADIDGLEPEVRDWEPRVALDGGPDGFVYYRRLAATDALRRLRPGAWVVLEIGAGQRAGVEACFADSGAFDPPLVMRDHAGIERVLGLRRRAEESGWMR
jgi:release factor glutamine methyltransferase